MAEGDKPDTISLEAHERVQQENASLKEQVGSKDEALSAFARVDDAYAYFASKEGLSDPYGVARAAANDLGVRGADPDSLPQALDTWLEKQSALFGSPTATADGEPVSEPAAPETPAIGGPTPNADGKTPSQPDLTKEEFDKLGFKAKQKAINEGRIILKGEHYQSLVDAGAVKP